MGPGPTRALQRADRTRTPEKGRARCLHEASSHYPECNRPDENRVADHVNNCGRHQARAQSMLSSSVGAACFPVPV
jgi:hypothetical protein